MAEEVEDREAELILLEVAHLAVVIQVAVLAAAALAVVSAVEEEVLAAAAHQEVGN